ncbi:MAG: glycine cleavage system protein GcvH [Proteobacteria bacterium]|nr:glycine cleavage system protein GcvH [Pseudomonadota bacterium]NOG59633.1 glycine cleavage system protein GcvH [Pseudomonadota bacterium]
MTKKYSKDHEWLEIDADGIATIGITDFAQKELGDVVYVELPEVDSEVNQDDEVSVVESVKAASDVKVPIGGQVVAVNESLNDNPELVNSDAEGEAWFFKIKPSNLEEIDSLMDESAYQDFIN